MKTNPLVIILPAIISLIFFSCSKDRLDDKIQQKSTEYSDLEDFYEDNQPEEQEFVIDSIGGDTIVAQEGTKIYDVPKEIFMRKSDQSDITYPYVIKLIEAYSIKSRILSGLNGLAQGNVLSSDGNLRFRAFKDNDELEIKQDCRLPFLVPCQTPDPFKQVFYGFTTGTTEDWNNNVLQAGYLFPVDNATTISIHSYGYQAATAKTGWVNIAGQYSGNTSTSITFTTDGTNTQYVDIFVIFENLHAFVKVQNMQVSGLPTGVPIQVVAIGKDTSGQMYYFTGNYITNQTMLIEIQMNQATESEILSGMDSL